MPVIARPIQPLEGLPPDELLINHDLGGVDALRVVSADGQGVGNVAIRMYLTADYNARTSNAKVRGKAVTLNDGRWATRIHRDSRLAYTLIFTPPDDRPSKRVDLPVGGPN